jgi:predicted GTPase
MRTLAVFGTTGVGKSELLNAWLQAQLFEVSDGMESQTQMTAARERRVSGVVWRGIDTPGLGDSRGRDGQNLKQMAQFFQDLQGGVNAFAIVLNFQSPRFEQMTQKMLKIANAFFDEPRFWDHVCIVFTKVYPKSKVDKLSLAEAFHREVIGLIRRHLGQHVLEKEPKLPKFFVDSPEWQTDTDTATQLQEMHKFIASLVPLSTHGVVAQDPKYLFIRTEENVRTDLVSRDDVARKDYNKTEAEPLAIMGGSLGGGAVLGLGVGVGVGIAVGAAGGAVATGAGIGAAVGMAAGPIGAAIGAGVGVAVGAVVGGITWVARRDDIVAVKVHLCRTVERWIVRTDWEGDVHRERTFVERDAKVLLVDPSRAQDSPDSLWDE